MKPVPNRNDAATAFQPTGLPTRFARKYNSIEDAIRAGYKGYWRKDAWPEGLYMKCSNGHFFHRFRNGRTRTFKQLETDDLVIAKRRLRDRANEVSDLRESRRTRTDFNTLGTCAAEMQRILERSDRQKQTVAAYKGHVARLRTHWQRGSFDRYSAARVDLDAIMELRHHLKSCASFAAGRVTKNVKSPKVRTGYSNNVVNQTLWALRVILDIAVAKRMRAENPFVSKSSLEKKISLPKGVRKPILPSTETMQKLFAEMRREPANRGIETKRGADYLAWRQYHADRAADLAEFLAHTGCRHEEALEVRVSDIDKNKPGFLYVDGTKSRQSKRDVPIAIPGLRTLLDRLTRGKKPNDSLFDEGIECRQSLARACGRLNVPKLVPHDLRHYFATVMLEEGVSFALLGEWLGHADGGLLAAKTYGHVRRSHADAEAQRIGASLAKKWGEMGHGSAR